MPADVTPIPLSMGITPTQRYLPWVVAIALLMEQLGATIVNTGIPASGWLAERFGSRRVFLSAVALFTPLSALMFRTLRPGDGDNMSRQATA